MLENGRDGGRAIVRDAARGVCAQHLRALDWMLQARRLRRRGVVALIVGEVGACESAGVAGAWRLE